MWDKTTRWFQNVAKENNVEIVSCDYTSHKYDIEFKCNVCHRTYLRKSLAPSGVPKALKCRHCEDEAYIKEITKGNNVEIIDHESYDDKSSGKSMKRYRIKYKCKNEACPEFGKEVVKDVSKAYMETSIKCDDCNSIKPLLRKEADKKDLDIIDIEKGTDSKATYTIKYRCRKCGTEGEGRFSSVAKFARSRGCSNCGRDYSVSSLELMAKEELSREDVMKELGISSVFVAREGATISSVGFNRKNLDVDIKVELLKPVRYGNRVFDSVAFPCDGDFCHRWSRTVYTHPGTLFKDYERLMNRQTLCIPIPISQKDSSEKKNLANIELMKRYIKELQSGDVSEISRIRKERIQGIFDWIRNEYVTYQTDFGFKNEIPITVKNMIYHIRTLEEFYKHFVNFKMANVGSRKSVFDNYQSMKKMKETGDSGSEEIRLRLADRMKRMQAAEFKVKRPLSTDKAVVESVQRFLRRNGLCF